MVGSLPHSTNATFIVTEEESYLVAKAMPPIYQGMLSEDLNLHIFEEHIKPQDMITYDDLKATQVELLQQEMLQYYSVEKKIHL